ncbi:hypothetical protein HELRODRAFT_175681 [Helobdella robusta]|uniref:Uncharacterized protein n=1 Tax=Helobdella robusta TaxID=6412 RepID=T1F9I8_HELRO|nr:hypothetical protein HELRODRAFT_175681 [Helobdella robusta]ESO00695.1 hypothetical protein HELRODRAFT_175681 [Helobdella robusta]
MEVSVEKLLEHASANSEKLELLKEEKLRVYDILEHSGRQTHDETFSRMNGQARLDKDIIKVVRSFTEKLNDMARIAEDSEKKLREASKQMHEMKSTYDQELQERDRNIRYLAGCLEKSEKESNERKEEMEKMKKKTEQATLRIAELDDQVRYWERYRHYGYWYTRRDRDDNQLSKSMKELNLESKVPSVAIPRTKKLLTSRLNSQNRKLEEKKSQSAGESTN